MARTVRLRLLYSSDAGSRRLSLKLLLMMRKDSGTRRRSSWTAAGSWPVVLLGLGPSLVGVCLGAVLPSDVTRVGKT